MFTLPQCDLRPGKGGQALKKCLSPMGIRSMFKEQVIRADLDTPLFPDLQPWEDCSPQSHLKHWVVDFLVMQ